MAKPTEVEFEGQTVLAEELDFEAEKEPWTVYKLEDGTVLKFKQALAKVCRLIDRFRSDGEPIYVLQIGGLIHTDVPPGLKKKVD